jgi:hypothetical protein
MTIRSKYHDTLFKLKSRSDFSFRLLLDSLEYEHGKPDQFRMILLEDILTNNESELVRVFKEMRDVSVSEVAFNALTSLPPQVIKDNSMIFDRIFLNAINNKYKDAGTLVINNIRSIISKTKAGLGIELLVKSIQDERIDVLNRTRLAICLTELDDYGDFFNWQSVDLKNKAWLLPAFLFHYGKKNSKFAFSEFYSVINRPEEDIVNHIYTPLSQTIKQLVYVDDLSVEYFRYTNKSKNSWQNILINEIVESDKEIQSFLETKVSNLANLNRVTKFKEFRIGFPRGYQEFIKEVLEMNPIAIRRNLENAVTRRCAEAPKVRPRLN